MVEGYGGRAVVRRTTISPEALWTKPAVAIGIADRAWTIGNLLEAALAVAPADPTETAPDRRRRFRIIEGGA